MVYGLVTAETLGPTPGCDREHGVAVTSSEFAALMDEADPLKRFRSEFSIPKNKDLSPSASPLLCPWCRSHSMTM